MYYEIYQYPICHFCTFINSEQNGKREIRIKEVHLKMRNVEKIVRERYCDHLSAMTETLAFFQCGLLKVTTKI